MGCGQSKINIYPRKSKGKNSSKKRVTGDKPEGEEDDAAENERNLNGGDGNGEDGDDCDGKKKPARTKPIGHVGGPLLAQSELSNSQQNFFKMLDDKIDNGPDYDSNDETEIALERARLHTLLKDWETASASSRSLPNTPRHMPRQPQIDRSIQSAPKSHSRIPPNVIHQSYGISVPHAQQIQQIQQISQTQMSYRQTNYNPAYQTHSPTHQPHYIPPNISKISPGMQYQDYTASYNVQPPYSAIPAMTPRQYTIPNTVPSSGSPVHYANNSPKHKYPSHPQNPAINPTLNYSPTHKIYVTPQNQNYTNGELLIQQQLYNQQIQYQQSREYQQYRQSREQLLVQQQISQGAYGTAPPPRGSHYQSSVHVPIVAVLPQNEQSPKMSLQRKQRQYSQEMT